MTHVRSVWAVALCAALLMSACSTTLPSSDCTKGNGQVITTSTGLQYEDLEICKGAETVVGKTVSVHYLGTLENGAKFDSSFDRNQPLDFVLGAGGVIKGWDEGVQGMRVGSKRRLIVPASLGYGTNGFPPTIPPNATLIFTVQVINVK